MEHDLIIRIKNIIDGFRTEKGMGNLYARLDRICELIDKYECKDDALLEAYKNRFGELTEEDINRQLMVKKEVKKLRELMDKKEELRKEFGKKVDSLGREISIVEASLGNLRKEEKIANKKRREEK